MVIIIITPSLTFAILALLFMMLVLQVINFSFFPFFYFFKRFIEFIYRGFNMKKFKIVFNNLNERYNVVELNEDCYACPIGQGKTKSEAMRNAYANHRFCQDALRKHFNKKNEEQEDVIILFDYEE